MKKVKVGSIPSTFSNYGQTSVDVFAPGSEIYNSIPQSDYKILQGTSMACPIAWTNDAELPRKGCSIFPEFEEFTLEALLSY